MFTRVLSASVHGVEPVVVTVEVSLTRGLPSLTIVGLPQNAVREGRERVVAALRHVGATLPPRRVVVNLAPADVRKEGSGLDLALAVALLAAIGEVDPALAGEVAVLGELGLDGGVRPIRGTLSRVAGLSDAGCRRVVVPWENRVEAEAIGGPEILAVRNLRDVVRALGGSLARRAEDIGDATDAPPADGRDATAGRGRAGQGGAWTDPPGSAHPPDLADVRGQLEARRALEIAAAGAHNLLLVGPPGTGKSLLAARLPGILPAPGREEALAVTRIHSVAGLLGAGCGLMNRRPFRAPHHSVTEAGMGGGGRPIRPGELSLAHHGVLFLDELPEFRRSVLELLREPLETGEILLSRAEGAVRLPARVLLVAAMNPCPCGWNGDASGRCTCPPPVVERYRSRVSGPLLDRIDLHVRVRPVAVERLAEDARGESSEVVAARVAVARARARSRSGGPNAALTPGDLRRHAAIEPDAVDLFARAQHRAGLSARAFHRVLRVARTIADLAGSAGVTRTHVAEALHFREFDRPVR